MHLNEFNHVHDFRMGHKGDLIKWPVNVNVCISWFWLSTVSKTTVADTAMTSPGLWRSAGFQVTLSYLFTKLSRCLPQRFQSDWHDLTWSVTQSCGADRNVQSPDTTVKATVKFSRLQFLPNTTNIHNKMKGNRDTEYLRWFSVDKHSSHNA